MESGLGSLIEMAKGQRHCDRIVVSDLWQFCPFCGSSLTVKASASNSSIDNRRQSSLLALDSFTVRKLRAYLSQNGLKVSGKKSDLVERLVTYMEDNATLKYDF